MNKILRVAMTAAAFTLATPAFAHTVRPDVDFEWYANVGRYDTVPVVSQPAPREGFIWTPAHWETRGDSQYYVPARWVVDDYAAQLAIHNKPKETQ